MTVKASGTIYQLDSGGHADDNTNASLCYEVYKYIKSSTALNALITDAKNSAGTSPAWNSMEDFRGFSRHNGKVFVTMTNSPYGCEIHVADHTDPPPLGGDQLGSDVSNSASESEVGDLWGDGTGGGGGDTNDINVTKNGDAAYVSGDAYKMRYQTRDRFASVWGAWGSWVDPFLSTDIVEAMRENDIHIELMRTYGRLYTTNNHATYAFIIDQDSGAVQDTVPLSDNVTEKSHANDASVAVKFKTSGDADITNSTTPMGDDLGVTIKRRTKLTSGAWTTVWGKSIGYFSVADTYTCAFGTYDYLFEIDEV